MSSEILLAIYQTWGWFGELPELAVGVRSDSGLMTTHPTPFLHII